MDKSANVDARRNEPLLGQAGGAYRERAVWQPLAPIFSRAWFHLRHELSRQSTIVPDGCADIVFVNGVLVVAGPDRRAKPESSRPGATVVGLRFRPGAALSLVGTAAAEIVDARVPLERFWGG